MRLNKSHKTSKLIVLEKVEEDHGGLYFYLRSKRPLEEIVTNDLKFLKVNHSIQKFGSMYMMFDIFAEVDYLFSGLSLWIYVGENYWFCVSSANDRWAYFDSSLMWFTGVTKEDCTNKNRRIGYSTKSAYALEGIFSKESIVEHFKKCGVKVNATP